MEAVRLPDSGTELPRLDIDEVNKEAEDFSTKEDLVGYAIKTSRTSLTTSRATFSRTPSNMIAQPEDEDYEEDEHTHSSVLITELQPDSGTELPRLDIDEVNKEAVPQRSRKRKEIIGEEVFFFFKRPKIEFLKNLKDYRELPEETLVKIFYYIDKADQIKFSNVCRQFNAIYWKHFKCSSLTLSLENLKKTEGEKICLLISSDLEKIELEYNLDELQSHDYKWVQRKTMEMMLATIIDNGANNIRIFSLKNIGYMFQNFLSQTQWEVSVLLNKVLRSLTKIEILNLESSKMDLSPGFFVIDSATLCTNIVQLNIEKFFNSSYFDTENQSMITFYISRLRNLKHLTISQMYLSEAFLKYIKLDKLEIDVGINPYYKISRKAWCDFRKANKFIQIYLKINNLKSLRMDEIKYLLPQEVYATKVIITEQMDDPAVLPKFQLLAVLLKNSVEELTLDFKKDPIWTSRIFEQFKILERVSQVKIELIKNKDVHVSAVQCFKWTNLTINGVNYPKAKSGLLDIVISFLKPSFF